MRLLFILAAVLASCAEESPGYVPDADLAPLAVPGLYADDFCRQDPRVAADTPHGVPLTVSGLAGLWVVAADAVAQPYSVCSTSTDGQCVVDACHSVDVVAVMAR